MEIKINIDEAELQELITQKIAADMVRGYPRQASTYAVRDAVKEVVYSNKDEIIERCVKRASTELVKKGLPKLIEEMTK